MTLQMHFWGALVFAAYWLTKRAEKLHDWAATQFCEASKYNQS